MFKLQQINKKEIQNKDLLDIVHEIMNTLPTNLLHFLVLNKFKVILHPKKHKEDFCMSCLDKFEIHLNKDVKIKDLKEKIY